MLVLKLRRDQSARIGPHVVVTCVKNEAGALVLAITAPPEWKISREEHLTDGAATNDRPSDS
jgi:sRNA-binding carbon storage regulator CsrA